MHQDTNKFLLLDQKKYLSYINKLDNSSKNLDLDILSYFIIAVNRKNKYILVEQFCYNNEGDIYSLFFKGPTAKYLCSVIFCSTHLSIKVSTTHALYLGRELMKSELALILDQQYIQD